MEIFLIRHTTPDVGKGIIYGKRLPVPLAASFLEEAGEIKNKIMFSPDKVFSSPALRCTLLADYLFPSKYSIDGRLHEMDFGEWEGKTWDELPQAALQQWMGDYENTSPPDGESMKQMQQRVLDFTHSLNHPSKEKIIIITHAGVIRLLLSHYNKIPMSGLFMKKIAFGEIRTIELS